MDLNYINIIGTIKDNSTNSTVAESSQIYDRALDKKQSEVNTQVYQKLSALENNKEKCLGFFTSSELLPTDDVQLGNWAIVPGNTAWYIWTYNGSQWQQTSEEYAQQEINIQGLATVASSGSYDDLSNKPTRLSQFVNDSGYLTQNDLASVATTGSYTDLINKPTNISSFTNDAGYITQQDISDKVDAADLATVATTGSYNDLSNKPTILTINDIDSRVGAILNSSEDAVAALRELINELESTDGATVVGILSSLDAINQDVSGLNTRLDTAESNIQQIIDNQSTPTVNVPKHIIIEQGQYDENNYEQDAIYFILSSASTAWTFGGNFPISLT